MARRSATAGLAAAVACVLLPMAVGSTAAGSEVAASRRSTPPMMSAPAYVDRTALEARIPRGDLVDYRLPTLPSGASRVLGDWDGDRAQTPGIFADGRWQLWNQVVRPKGADLVASFGQAGDIPVTGDWNGDGVTDIGVVRGST